MSISPVRVGLVGLVFLAACRNLPDPALTQLVEARKLAADLHVQFVKAADASDRAVLADTDEASVAFAHEADAAAQSVQSDLAELGTRLQGLHYDDETKLLDELGKRFADYRKVDRDILSLAVANTNLKAQRLAFGPIRDAADQLKATLGLAVGVAAAKDRARAEAAVAEAVIAVREIEVLQAPHIAEADATAMGHLEEEMSKREQAARTALETLRPLLPRAKDQLAAATVSLDQFRKLSADLVSLSRQNTNVRSLALSLRPKPALTAACDSTIASLEEALGKHGFTATR
ncbi:MAG TPA: hypothetical protein VHJ20_23210 [Polyangia bacterium]|nr:hypothetical protein [Polyangia bacterium]